MKAVTPRVIYKFLIYILLIFLFFQFYTNWYKKSFFDEYFNEYWCPRIPPNLTGKIEVIKHNVDINELNKNLSLYVDPGGQGKPINCVQFESVAIIIPYRDREIHLGTLLANLHPFLQKQQRDYRIFVIEQSEKGAFNRAKLFNVGFIEALKRRLFRCFIFHDVDLIPENDKNIYSCSNEPRHMAVSIDKYLYQLPYIEYFGGVNAIKRKQFQQINGLSNIYWAWGGDDDDFSRRIANANLDILRYPKDIGVYTALPHTSPILNPDRSKLLQESNKRFKTDGLNSLKYNVLKYQLKPLYTWILVDISDPIT